MLVISDTSPIRALEWISRVDILKTLFGEVIVPPTVAFELQRSDGPHRPIDLAPFDFIRIVAPIDTTCAVRLSTTLDPGESEAIALALETTGSLLLIDEKSGRQTARELHLKTVGTVGILILAKERELIPTLAPLLERLTRELNFFLSEELVKRVLKQVGELLPFE